MDKQSAPQCKYHPPYEDECPAQPMSAPRTNAAIAEEEADIARHFAEENRPINDAELKRLDCIAESLTKHDIDDAEVVWRAYRQLSALRKEASALPADSDADAEIERIAALLGHDSNGSEFTQALAAIRRLYAPPALPADGMLCRVCGDDILYDGPNDPAHPGYDHDFTPALPAEVDAVLAKLEKPCCESCCSNPCPQHLLAATLLRRYAQAVAEKDAKLQAVEALCADAKNVSQGWVSIERVRAILREEH